MLLKVMIESNLYSIDVPDDALKSAESFFNKMDQDMDKGWQMNREWVPEPSKLQRCQIAADKLADAIESGNDALAQLTSGYILTHLPDVKEVQIDTEGDMQETQFI